MDVDTFTESDCYIAFWNQPVGLAQNIIRDYIFKWDYQLLDLILEPTWPWVHICNPRWNLVSRILPLFEPTNINKEAARYDLYLQQRTVQISMDFSISVNCQDIFKKSFFGGYKPNFIAKSIGFPARDTPRIRSTMIDSTQICHFWKISKFPSITLFP